MSEKVARRIDKMNVIAAIILSAALASQTAYAQLKAHTKHPNQLTDKAKFSMAEDRAIALVEKVKEVQAWMKEFGPKGFNPRTQGRPAFSVEEHNGPVYLVNVSEDMPDHNVTFARFQVNVKTGSVTKVE